MEKLCRSRSKPPVLPDNLVSRDVLIAAFEHLKMHYETLSLLMTEVAALRETLLKQNGSPFVAYDEVIRRIKAM